jgi:hypothetical protein
MMIALIRWSGSPRADEKTSGAQNAAQKNKRLATTNTKAAKKSVEVNRLR